MIIEEFATEPRPSNIHTHTLERNLDRRVRHLLRSVRMRIGMRRAHADAPKTPAGRSSNGPGRSLGLGLFVRVARRDLERDRSPEIRIIFSICRSVGRRGRSGTWDTSLIGIRILEFDNDIRRLGSRAGLELSALLLVLFDLGIVGCDLGFDELTFVFEEFGLGGPGGIGEPGDVLFVHGLEVFGQSSSAVR